MSAFVWGTCVVPYFIAQKGLWVYRHTANQIVFYLSKLRASTYLASKARSIRKH
jgi:hypothetical protein